MLKYYYLIPKCQNSPFLFHFCIPDAQSEKNNGYHLIGCKNKVAIQHAEALRRRYSGQGFDFKFVNENKAFW